MEQTAVQNETVYTYQHASGEISTVRSFEEALGRCAVLADEEPEKARLLFNLYAQGMEATVDQEEESEESEAEEEPSEQQKPDKKPEVITVKQTKDELKIVKQDIAESDHETSNITYANKVSHSEPEAITSQTVEKTTKAVVATPSIAPPTESSRSSEPGDPTPVQPPEALQSPIVKPEISAPPIAEPSSLKKIELIQADPEVKSSGSPELEYAATLEQTDRQVIRPPASESLETTKNEHEIPFEANTQNGGTLEEFNLPLEEIEMTLEQLTAKMAALEPEAAQVAQQILDEIMALPAKLDISPDGEVDQEEIQQELDKLFTSLFDHVGIEYTPELLDTFGQFVIGQHFEKAQETQKDMNAMPKDKGTHEFITKLLAGISNVKKALIRAYLVGKSAMRLYTLSSDFRPVR